MPPWEAVSLGALDEEEGPGASVVSIEMFVVKKKQKKTSYTITLIKINS